MRQPPNILLITTDHLRYDTLGYSGDPVLETPSIDKLALESTRFSNCFVQSPVCKPSRATIMTGRYPRHHGVRWNGSNLSENEVTMLEFFHHHGYSTACIGKHHISQRKFINSLDYLEAQGIRRNWTENPDGIYQIDKENPFEEYVSSRGYTYKTGYALQDFRKNLGAVPSDLPADCHIDAYVGQKGQNYLQQVNGKDPFFLWLGFYGPHHPYVPSGRFARMYHPDDVPSFRGEKQDLQEKPLEYQLYCQTENHKFRGFNSVPEETFRQMKAAYYGTVSQIDWQIGLILETLEKENLKENTIIVFISDHGEFLGDYGIPAKAPFLLDCMLHVPCLIYAPNNQNDITYDDLIESVDLFPTLANLAELAPPDCVQGKILPPFDTTESYHRREVVYAEAVDKKCLRTKEWKLIHYPAKDYGELYNLIEDPHERNNLYTELSEIRHEMTLQLYHYLDATEDFKHPSYQRFTSENPETGEEITHYHTW